MTTRLNVRVAALVSPPAFLKIPVITA